MCNCLFFLLCWYFYTRSIMKLLVALILFYTLKIILINYVCSLSIISNSLIALFSDMMCFFHLVLIY